MNIIQREITITPKIKGFHLITNEVLSNIPELNECKSGLLHIFIKHTSASLTINENYDPDVRKDMEKYFMKFVPEHEPYFEHNSEGADDMPAHIKASIIGSSITIPIRNGKMELGTWQGIYLGEHRNNGGARRLFITFIKNN